MADTWSGFCAYTYDGNPDFDMFHGGPWNGRDVLEPTQDFVNFGNQLATNAEPVYNDTLVKETQVPLCKDVLAEMLSCCDGVFEDHHIELYNIDKIPSYRHQQFYALGKDSPDDDNFSIAHSGISGNGVEGFALVVAVLLLSVSALLIQRSRRRIHAQRVSNEETEAVSINVNYQSIN